MRMRNGLRLRRAGEIGVADARPLVSVPIGTGCRRATIEPTCGATASQRQPGAPGFTPHPPGVEL